MYESKKEEIIRLWMAEGLLQSGKRGKRIEDVGNEYFEDLISRSLFQPLSKDKSTILMHDLTHDLAIFVSGEFSCRSDDGDKAKFSGKTRHVSYSKMKDLERIEGLSMAKSLRTFIGLGSLYQACPISKPQLEQLVSIGGCLRALCLSGLAIIELPGSIGNLKHLRYLDLSSNDNITEIPNTLCRLYNLQTLRLSWCKQLTMLPNDMGNLVNLRHLEIEGVPLEKMPPMMRKMKDLQTLSQFVLCKRRGSSIKELGGLRYLSGRLEICKLENVEVVQDVLEANLRDKSDLKKLVFRWSSNDVANESPSHGEVLDALQPHTNVKELCIEGYGGETFSNWVGHHSYANMVTVYLLNCHHCCSLPPFGQLPSLQSLKIYNCRGVERINAEFYGVGSSNTKPFRSLEVLTFQGMSAWQDWSIPEGREDGGCFPSLEHLHISNCPKLSGCLPDYLPSLEIFIEDCPELETFLLCNFPSNLKTLEATTRISEITGRYENVKRFPETLLPTTLTSVHIKRLENLTVLNGEGFEHLTCLEELIIEDCKELQCFLGLQHLNSLKELRISYCKNLRCLSGTGLPASLTSLYIVVLPSLEDIGDDFLRHRISLEDLQIRYCENLQYNAVEENGKGVLEQLISLKTLSLRYCEKLQSLLEGQLPTSLTHLEIGGFSRLRDLNRMGFQHLCSLKELNISYCKNLRCLSGTGLPASLTCLRIEDLSSLEDVDDGFFRHLISLEELKIENCKNLQYNAVEENGKGVLEQFISLKRLVLSNCEKLQSLLEEQLPTSLTSLDITGFPRLRDLNRMGFQHLCSLEKLTISDCENLECLPDQRLPSSLRISGCPLLE